MSHPMKQHLIARGRKGHLPQHPLMTWRRENRLPAYKFARQLEVGASYLSKVERWHLTPSLKMAARMAKLTKWAVRPEQFLLEYAEGL